jgi:hypothetical protein
MSTRGADRSRAAPPAEVRRAEETAGEQPGVYRIDPPVDLVDPQRAVHALLFMLEFAGSWRHGWKADVRCLNFFFTRHCGLHLLLMLLNAYYNKPLAGRRAGWVFSALEHRLDISERGLRILVQDAIAEGLIEQQSVENSSDRRCRSYKVTPKVVNAWEALVETMGRSVGDAFRAFDPGALANVDYREWNPEQPARLQRNELPPHRLKRRTDA